MVFFTLECVHWLQYHLHAHGYFSWNVEYSIKYSWLICQLQSVISNQSDHDHADLFAGNTNYVLLFAD